MRCGSGSQGQVQPRGCAAGVAAEGLHSKGGRLRGCTTRVAAEDEAMQWWQSGVGAAAKGGSDAVVTTMQRWQPTAGAAVGTAEGLGGWRRG